MKLSDIRAHLETLQMQPSKSLGQNFLHDQNLAKWMINQLEITHGTQVVEVGPGLGALTEFLLPQVSKLTAIEKDGRLAGFLRDRFAAEPKFEIFHADACQFDIRSLFPDGPAVLIGNLPYYVSTAIILNFLTEPTPIHSALFTLQREVAERLSAQPGTSEYGSLTIAIQQRWKVKYLKTLPGSVFYPEPKVESAVVLLTPLHSSERPMVRGEAFESWVRKGFSQRRKQLRKTLDLKTEEWEGLAAKVDCSTTARAEELSISQWVGLVQLLTKSTQKTAQDVDGELFDIVNSDDIVISKASRAEVHEGNLEHRAVHVLIFNKAGDLFLQKRSHLKDREPGKWDSSASGHLDSGEDYDAAAQRETLEELGISTELHVIGKLPPSELTGHEFIQVYRGEHRGPFHWPPAEIETGAFFSMDVIHRWTRLRSQDFAPGFLQCLAFLNCLDMPIASQASLLPRF